MGESNPFYERDFYEKWSAVQMQRLNADYAPKPQLDTCPSCGESKSARHAECLACTYVNGLTTDQQFDILYAAGLR